MTMPHSKITKIIFLLILCLNLRSLSRPSACLNALTVCRVIGYLDWICINNHLTGVYLMKWLVNVYRAFQGLLTKALNHTYSYQALLTNAGLTYEGNNYLCVSA